MTQPTIGSNVEEVLYKNIRFQMWDLGGQETLRPSWTIYYVNTSVSSELFILFFLQWHEDNSLFHVIVFMCATCQAVILVVDSTDKERIHIVKDELFRMLTHQDLSQAKILVYANKQDVSGAMTAAEVSKALNLVKIKHHDWHIQSSCALTGQGLFAGLDWLVDKLKSKK